MSLKSRWRFPNEEVRRNYRGRSLGFRVCRLGICRSPERGVRVERQLSRLTVRALVALLLAAWLVFGFMGVQWVQELPIYLILVAGLFTLLQEAARRG